MNMSEQYMPCQHSLSKTISQHFIHGSLATRFNGLGMRLCTRAWSLVAGARSRILQLRREDSGQGTTEYAILVGVLVVIAIAAIILFRSKVQSLWDAIVAGFDSL